MQPVFIVIYLYLFECTMPLVESEFPDQGLNLGFGSKSVES